MLTAQPLRRLRILHIEPSAADHAKARAALELNGSDYAIERIETLAELSDRLERQVCDVVVAAYYANGFTAMDAWDIVLGSSRVQPPFIVLSNSASESDAIDAIRRGVSDFVRKSALPDLPRAIVRAIGANQMRTVKEDSHAELAGSMRRSSELNEYLQACLEEERQSIAREVHDDIGGSLAAVKFDLAWIGRRAKDPAIVEHVNGAIETLQHAIDASQRIVQDLRPPILDQGIVAAVDWLATAFERRTGVKTSFTATHETIDASDAVKLVAYRTAQEALTNIAKHAECSEVHIDLSDGENVLTLEVTDNGRGLTRAELDKPKTFGLKGLGERARTVDGWLDISNQGGVGTSIILSVPLERAET
ncbi:sensor histidine kinase [Variovorax sp. PAMC28562]|uniref:hybrid sensor histidine kinase/response regulator n=1 Tax=Variovorax sp. PAMC28562 TaxID=2762323 RepID=UPI00164EB54B|nr:histidine kinase [Variovorax sp. PAMC28562]QNK74330.1 sensor histidine kinase [Variovorax sp. PAMC28562]